MPIPMQIYMPTDYNDKRFLSQNDVKLKWTLWPRRCQVSGRWLWLTKSYCARYVITGPGDPCIWHRWYSDKEYMILKLKGY